MNNKRPARICDIKPLKGAVHDAFSIYALSVLGVLASHALVYYLWPWYPRHSVDLGLLVFTQGIAAFGAGLLSYLSTSHVQKEKPDHVRSVWRSILATIVIVAVMSSLHAFVMNAEVPGFLPHNFLEALSYQIWIAPVGYRWFGFVEPKERSNSES